jgi:hypothetical protein
MIPRQRCQVKKIRYHYGLFRFVHGGRFSAYKEVGNKELAGVCLFGLGFGDEYVASSIRYDCKSPTKMRDGPTYALAKG